jgi:hypothetical protein
MTKDGCSVFSSDTSVSIAAAEEEYVKANGHPRLARWREHAAPILRRLRSDYNQTPYLLIRMRSSRRIDKKDDARRLSN